MLGSALVAAPAVGDASGNDAFVVREDATSGAGTAYAWSPTNGALKAWADADGVGIGRDTAAAAPSSGDLHATFWPPAGGSLQAGVTYPAVVGHGDAPDGSAWVHLDRDGMLCGRGVDDVYGPTSPKITARGWFRVAEIERDVSGQVVRFSATFELNCQLVGGPPGIEGTVAVNASMPAAAVPDAPPTPGPVRALAATNAGPNLSGETRTTLTWTSPPGVDDVSVDMVSSEHAETFPQEIGRYPAEAFYRGTEGRHGDRLDFMDTRTYRAVAHGPTGRLGPPSLLLVMGTRLDVPVVSRTITIGHPVTFSGRLSLAWDYVHFSDVMNGPGLEGRRLLLCRRDSYHYSDNECSAVDQVRTAEDGRFQVSAVPQENSIYDVVVPATDDMIGNVARVITMVAPQTDLTAQEAVPTAARTARTVARSGCTIHFSTSTARAGSRGVVQLQRSEGRRWRTLMTRAIPAGAKGRLSMPYCERRSGVHSYRVVKLADAKHVNGHSRIVTVRTR